MYSDPVKTNPFYVRYTTLSKPVCNDPGGTFIIVKKKICMYIVLNIYFLSTLSEWNSTPGPETGEYFTRWQRQC